MKWEMLKEYIEHTIKYSERIEMPSSTDQAFIFGFKDIQRRMEKLEADDE